MAASTFTSTYNYCTPSAATTVTSTVYTIVLPAACETGIWDATYTITDYCYDSCHGYEHPKIPPGFGVSTVHCPVCPTPEVVITCPTLVPARPTGSSASGVKPPPVITGNGVTASCVDCGGHATPTITVYEEDCTKDCAPKPTITTYPPGPVVPPVNPPVNPPVVPGTASHPAMPPVNPPVYPVNPPVHPANSNGPAPPAVTKPATGTQATTPPVYPTKPVVVVAGAPSVSRSLGVISGLAAIVGYIYLL